MKRGYKFRIYPTDEQKRLFAVNFAANRWWWNYCLEKINKHYEETNEHLSAQYKVARELPAIKKNEETKWLKGADATSLINTSIDLDAAFKKFFTKKGGFPKFKRKNYDDSYKCDINIKTKNIIDFKRKTINIGKVRNVPIVLHKKIKGVFKSITVSKKSYDYYEVSILIDDEFVPLDKKEPTIEGTIGIDLGVKSDSNAILSNNLKFETINCDKELKQLKRLQRKLAKKQWIDTGETKFSKKYNKEVKVKRPSKNYIKIKDKIAKLNDKIAQKRNYNTHQITSYVTKDERFDTICIEDLNVKGMVRNHHIAKSVANANMGEVKRQLEYKCDWYGKNLSVIDRFYASSQLCSVCGYKNEKTKNLSVRQWTCPICGTKHDRDVNAAINIANEGYRLLTEKKKK